MINYNVFWTPRKTKHLGKWTFKTNYSKKITNELIRFITECQITNNCFTTKDNFEAWIKIHTNNKIKKVSNELFMSAYDAGIVDYNGTCGNMKCYTLGRGFGDVVKVGNKEGEISKKDALALVSEGHAEVLEDIVVT